MAATDDTPHISVTVQGSNPEKVRAALQALLAGDGTVAAQTTTTTTTTETTGGKGGKGGKGKKDTDKPNISTGEERTDPKEAAAQDKADEKADKEEATKLTHDDVRSALGRYVEKYGIDAAQADGKKLLSMVFKDGKVEAISAIPDDQAALKSVIDGVGEMLEKNPFMRDEVKKS